MSIPVLVHKEDADRFDAVAREQEPIYNEISAFDLKLSWEACTGDDPETWTAAAAKQVEARPENVAMREGFLGRLNEVKERHDFDTIRIVTVFNPQPTDLENYYTYYRGFRWGEAKGHELMKVSVDGAAKCTELVKKMLHRHPGK